MGQQEEEIIRLRNQLVEITTGEAPQEVHVDQKKEDSPPKSKDLLSEIDDIFSTL